MSDLTVVLALTTRFPWRVTVCCVNTNKIDVCLIKLEKQFLDSFLSSLGFDHATSLLEALYSIYYDKSFVNRKKYLRLRNICLITIKYFHTETKLRPILILTFTPRLVSCLSTIRLYALIRKQNCGQFSWQLILWRSNI